MARLAAMARAGKMVRAGACAALTRTVPHACLPRRWPLSQHTNHVRCPLPPQKNTNTRHCQVIATIHQPNSTICDAFDDWLLLARGRLLYGGPWSGAVPWFKGRGHDCPLYVCPTDFFMNLASNPDTLAALADAYASVSGQAWLGVILCMCTRRACQLSPQLALVPCCC